MAKKNGSKARPTKSDVIRSMPNAAAADIIRKAKSLGLELTANHVYAVRAIDKRRGKPGRAVGANGGGAPTKPSNARSASKTDFIRGFGSDVPAAEVVAQARRAGVKISKEYVYRVRALSKPSLGRAGQGLSRSAGASVGPERRLTSLALEIGLLRASVLLDRLRARLAS